MNVVVNQLEGALPIEGRTHLKFNTLSGTQVEVGMYTKNGHNIALIEVAGSSPRVIRLPDDESTMFEYVIDHIINTVNV